VLERYATRAISCYHLRATQARGLYFWVLQILFRKDWACAQPQTPPEFSHEESNISGHSTATCSTAQWADTPRGRAQSRRVELTLVPSGSVTPSLHPHDATGRRDAAARDDLLAPDRPFPLRWAWRWRPVAGQVAELDHLVLARHRRRRFLPSREHGDSAGDGPVLGVPDNG
jgi:hypothetical protein